MIFMLVNSVETDFLFTQDSKSSFFTDEKCERGRRKRARGKNKEDCDLLKHDIACTSRFY